MTFVGLRCTEDIRNFWRQIRDRQSLTPLTSIDISKLHFLSPNTNLEDSTIWDRFMHERLTKVCVNHCCDTLHGLQEDIGQCWETRMVRWIYDILSHDGVLIEVLCLRHECWPWQVHRVAKTVEEAVPRLNNAVVGHVSWDETLIFFGYEGKENMA